MHFRNVPGRIRTADLLVGEPRGSSVQSGNDRRNMGRRPVKVPNPARTATRSGKRMANGGALDFTARLRQKQHYQQMLTDLFASRGPRGVA